MSQSILQGDNKVCYVCHTTSNLHRHEIFYGSANRKKSIKWGCQVWLCGYHHNMSPKGAHFDKELDLRLKREAQKNFELLYGKDIFLNEFHKSYL